MFGSGVGITMIVGHTAEVNQLTQYVLMYQAPIVSTGVVAGAAMRGTRVSPAAAGTMPPSATAAWVFVF